MASASEPLLERFYRYELDMIYPSTDRKPFLKNTVIPQQRDLFAIVEHNSFWQNDVFKTALKKSLKLH